MACSWIKAITCINVMRAHCIPTRLVSLLFWSSDVQNPSSCCVLRRKLCMIITDLLYSFTNNRLEDAGGNVFADTLSVVCCYDGYFRSRQSHCLPKLQQSQTLFLQPPRNNDNSMQNFATRLSTNLSLSSCFRFFWFKILAFTFNTFYIY